MQDPSVTEAESVQAFRRRRREEGPIFWAQDNFLAVFDAQAVQRLEAANYADLTMLDGFVDTVRGRASEPVTWNQLRSAWSAQMRTLTAADSLMQLAQRMDRLLGAEAGHQQDLVWLAERVSTESLVPAIVAGLPPAAHRRVIREVLAKVAWVLSDVDSHRASRWHRLKMIVYQVFAGIVVRRELEGRADGRRPRQQDLADPVVEMIPQLGIGRAVDTVTSLLTAITGSPGAAAACLFYELSKRGDWRARLETELSALPLEKLCESPMRLAPVTGRFIKEILRIWSSPPVVVRKVRTDIDHGQVSLKTGQHYVLSSFLIHHDETDWPNPETFDPDRWLADGRREQCPHGSYVPFGWAPKSCIGASLGMAQLVVLAHLVCTRYRLDVPDPELAKMAVASVVRPKDFNGAVVLR
ncbi:MAG: cytochrome P450 [Dokdonella sp.]